MSGLIRRAELFNELAPVQTLGEAYAVIQGMPEVDAVKVVHCCECKYVGTDATCCLVRKREGMGLRPFHVYHDDYCSYGEKDGDNGKNP